MSWSFRFGRIAGIDLKVHLTFFLAVVFGALQWGRPFGGEGAVFGALLILALFGCILLHELAHSLAAKAFGVPVREIMLLPLGGVALLERQPSRPLHELLIALVGPLTNVALALLLVVPLALTAPEGAPLVGGLLPTSAGAPSLYTALAWLLSANLVLAAFNMIPALPLDGGRILRAALAMWLGHERSTRIAAPIGKLLAVAIGAYALANGELLLALLAVFIFLGAGGEQAQAQGSSALSTIKAREAYNRHAITLPIGERVGAVANYILTSYQPDFAVMQGYGPIGIVTRDDVLGALARGEADGYVTGIMRREVVRVGADDTLEQVRQTMAERGARVVAVYDGDDYLGLVSAEDIAEAMLVASVRQAPGALIRT